MISFNNVHDSEHYQHTQYFLARTRVDRMLIPLRHLAILKDFVGQTYRLETKISSPFLACPIILFISRVRKENFQNRGVLTIILVSFLLLLGYYLIFLTSPHPLDWRLVTASGRLFSGGQFLYSPPV